jgi:outer membrane protein TolC
MALPALWLAALPAHAQDTPRGAELDALLARETRLGWVEQAARERHPALDESAARTRAALARAEREQRLPDPEFKYEQWAVPLKQPYALQRANMLMFGLRQAFPAPGVRAARGRGANEQAAMLDDQRRALERDLLLRVRRAYFAYYEADRALSVHLSHVQLAEQIIAQLRSSYEVGRSSQQDELKMMVELARLHNDVAEVTQQRETSRLLLNALMARAPDAPLGPPAEPSLPQSAPDIAALEKQRPTRLPELSLAAHAVRRGQATLDAATYGARRPSFMFGADYWLMPTLDDPHAYGAMLTMSLPWLNPGHRAEVREAQQLLAAERSAARAVDSSSAYELRAAAAGLQAARTSLEIIEEQLLPQSQQSLEAAQAAFSVGRGDMLGLLDALRSYYQVRLEHSRARARALSQLAELEFASGAALVRESAGEQRP